MESKGTLAKDKNEILFSRFGINYNQEPQVYRKGTVVYRCYDAVNGETKMLPTDHKLAESQSKTQSEKERKRKQKAVIIAENVDIIGDGFWEAHSYILSSR